MSSIPHSPGLLTEEMPPAAPCTPLAQPTTVNTHLKRRYQPLHAAPERPEKRQRALDENRKPSSSPDDRTQPFVQVDSVTSFTHELCHRRPPPAELHYYFYVATYLWFDPPERHADPGNVAVSLGQPRLASLHGYLSQTHVCGYRREDMRILEDAIIDAARRGKRADIPFDYHHRTLHIVEVPRDQYNNTVVGQDAWGADGQSRVVILTLTKQ